MRHLKQDYHDNSKRLNVSNPWSVPKALSKHNGFFFLAIVRIGEVTETFPI